MGMLLGCPENSQDVQDVQQQVQRYRCTALATVSVPEKNVCLIGVVCICRERVPVGLVYKMTTEQLSCATATCWGLVP